MSFVAALIIGTCSAAHADEERSFYMLNEGAWVCQSPDFYDRVVADQAEAGPAGLGQVMRDQEQAQTCMYIDDEMLEDTLAPFYVIEERQADKVRVSFTVEFYRKIEFLHRRITRITFVGWTGSDQLVEGSWYN